MLYFSPLEVRSHAKELAATPVPEWKERKGYWGNPGSATAEAGKMLTDAWFEKISKPFLRVLTENESPEKNFRSWYSVFPMNKTFFKGWVLIFLFGVLIFASMMLGLLF